MLSITSLQDFTAFENEVVQKFGFKVYGMKMTWPMSFVHLCEFAQTKEKVGEGMARVHLAMSQGWCWDSKRYLEGLRAEGSRQRCFMLCCYEAALVELELCDWEKQHLPPVGASSSAGRRREDAELGVPCRKLGHAQTGRRPAWKCLVPPDDAVSSTRACENPRTDATGSGMPSSTPAHANSESGFRLSSARVCSTKGAEN